MHEKHFCRLIKVANAALVWPMVNMVVFLAVINLAFNRTAAQSLMRRVAAFSNKYCSNAVQVAAY